MKRPSLAAGFLLAVHALVGCAEFVAPYDPTEQNRQLPLAPPTPLRFKDAQGRLHPWPFVYPQRERAGEPGRFEDDNSRRLPLRLFADGAPWRLGGLVVTRRHLFGVDEPGRLLLLGTDAYGRDQLSRLLHGGRLSLSAGLLAATLTLGLGLVVGLVAGFKGGWVDAVLMRLVELFLALPWLYLLLGARAFLPLHVPPARAFLLVVLLLAAVDWARPARIVRGVALAARGAEPVLAARGFGASDVYLMRRHVLPEALGVLLTQAALLVPQYVLAEVTLSFLGLGIGEPAPSWGNMLAPLQQYHVLASCWWMWLPALALAPVFLAYYALSDALLERARSGS
jgi:peptide/nickel transport system permease protein